MWILIVAGIGLVIAALLLSPIVVRVSLADTLKVVVFFWFLKYTVYPQKKKTKPKKKNKKAEKADQTPSAKKQGAVSNIRQIFKVLDTLFHGSLRLLKNGRVRNLRLTLGLTGEDAAAAAIHYGQVCSVVYPFLGLLDSHMKLIDPQVNVYCDYQGEKPVVEGSAKICISVFHAVGTAFYVIKELIVKNLKK